MMGIVVPNIWRAGVCLWLLETITPILPQLMIREDGPCCWRSKGSSPLACCLRGVSFEEDLLAIESLVLHLPVLPQQWCSRRRWQEIICWNARVSGGLSLLWPLAEVIMRLSISFVTDWHRTQRAPNIYLFLAKGNNCKNMELSWAQQNAHFTEGKLRVPCCPWRYIKDPRHRRSQRMWNIIKQRFNTSFSFLLMAFLLHASSLNGNTLLQGDLHF